MDTSNRYSETLTAQQVFDLCSYHLGTMPERSAVEMGIDKGHCMYRGPNGNTCAVGFFISDEEYDPEFENDPVDLLVAEKKFKRFQDHLNLLVALQHTHDSERTWEDDRSKMRDRLKGIALDYNLDYSILSNPDLMWNK